MKNRTHKIEKLRELEKEVANLYREAPIQKTPEEQDENFSKKAFEYALRVLSQRDYSTHKMQEKLKLRGFEKEVRENTLKRLIDMNYLKDTEFGQTRIKQLLSKGYANSYIIQKLQTEELQTNDEEINDVRIENELSLETQIESLISKKLKSQTIPNEFSKKMKLKQKITNFLASKGYDFETINTHLSPYLS